MRNVLHRKVLQVLAIGGVAAQPRRVEQYSRASADAGAPGRDRLKDPKVNPAYAMTVYSVGGNYLDVTGAWLG